MDQPLQSIFHPRKGPEINHAGDDALYNLTDVVALLCKLPGVGLQTLDTQTHTPTLTVYIEDVHLHGLARLKDVTGVIYPPPRKFRDVHQSLHPAQVHERAKGTEIGHAALTYVTGREFTQ
jgi:hypothetical protein